MPVADMGAGRTAGRRAAGNGDGARHAVQGIASRIRSAFHAFAHGASGQVGSPWAFILACGVVVAWAVTGPLFGWSDTWQLVINTGTTIVTFLMVFLIQNTQNRDAQALHLKLDEVIRALHGARNRLIDLEEQSDEDIERLRKEFQRVRGGANR
jgi:low affinity Fe/Cu permease